jgi:protein-S-isoprenylcysteine O-methyltransferase Ste14
MVPHWLLIIFGWASSFLYVGVGIAAWGSWTGYFGHPARAAFVVTTVVLTAVGSFTGVNLSRGKREDTRDRRIFAPLIVGSLLFAWLVPYMDRRDLWVIDGDAARYFGLSLYIVGGVLRVWPMFVLGRRFSGLVAIQENHELVTDGIYRYVRNPSYLGALLGFAGWALIFRSSVGLLLVGLGIWPLLASEFGTAYEEYRRRTWRLLPGVY